MRAREFWERRGLLPAVRVFIDYLAEKLPPLIEESSLNCRNCGKDEQLPAPAASPRRAAGNAGARATMR